MSRLKLLSKQEINQAKASERKMAIDEGLKLAKRVDTLREVHAEEEVSLQKFREQTLSAIHAETTKAEAELNTITREVEILKRERAEALVPIRDKWDEVNAANEACEKRGRELDTRSAALDARDTDLKEQGKLLNRLVGMAKGRAERVLGLQRDAEHDRDEARLALEQAEKVREDTLRYKEEVNTELRTRDAASAVRERELDVRTQAVDKREKGLDDRELRLKDREDTLARNLERYGRRIKRQ